MAHSRSSFLTHGRYMSIDRLWCVIARPVGEVMGFGVS